jgi:hypothetical protein
LGGYGQQLPTVVIGWQWKCNLSVYVERANALLSARNRSMRAGDTYEWILVSSLLGVARLFCANPKCLICI